MPITARFSPTAGLLSVFDDNLNNTIVVSRNVAGTIYINGGAVTVTGGTATVANTSLIQVFGTGGNDMISLDETNGALPAAQLFGGAGNDTLSAARATICCSAAPAMTRCWVRPATICCSAATATTR